MKKMVEIEVHRTVIFDLSLTMQDGDKSFCGQAEMNYSVILRTMTDTTKKSTVMLHCSFPFAHLSYALAEVH